MINRKIDVWQYVLFKRVVFEIANVIDITCGAMYTKFEDSIYNLEKKRTEANHTSQNILAIYNEMIGANKGLFMDHERTEMKQLLEKSRCEVIHLEEELERKMQYYIHEVRSMETLVDQRYNLLDKYNNVLLETPACASLLAKGQLDLHKELERRKMI